MQVQPSQISPAEPFDIFYFLRNHTDSTTYYVRAVVYDVRSGAVLNTVVLDQSPTNSRLFIKSVQAPPDYASGTGRNIVAIATVYSDSGFTTKSESYEEQEQYFLIRSAPVVIGGGGVDYRTLRDIFGEELKNAIGRMPKAPQLPDMPFDSLFGALGAIQREINRIPKDAPAEAIGTAPILAAIESVQRKIDALPTPERAAYSELMQTLANVFKELTDSHKDMQAKLAALATQYDKIMGGLPDRVRQQVDDALRQITEREQNVPAPEPQHKPQMPAIWNGPALALPVPSTEEMSSVRHLFA